MTSGATYSAAVAGAGPGRQRSPATGNSGDRSGEDDDGGASSASEGGASGGGTRDGKRQLTLSEEQRRERRRKANRESGACAGWGNRRGFIGPAGPKARDAPTWLRAPRHQ